MKKSKLALIAAIIGSLYFIYLISYFTNAVSTASGTSEVIGSGLASMIVAPHGVAVGVAVVFNWLGFALNSHKNMLVAGILYAVSIALFPIYFMFVIVEMILAFVAYSKMKKQEVK